MKTRSAILLGCGLLLLVAIIVLLVGGGFVYYVAKDPAGLAAYVESPEEVMKDEVFDLKVTVVNERRNKPLTVTSIDVAESYLAAFTVRGSDPAAKSSQRVPLEGGQSFGFDMVIPAGGTNIFVFHLRAAKTGVHRGDVDICEGMRFLTVMAQTQVK
jgi:hypothetical protein